MPRATIGAVIVLVCVGFAGCSHYHGAYPLGAGLDQQVRRDLAVAAVLDTRAGETNGTVSAGATAMLAQQAGAPDVLARLDPAGVALLLAEPAELSLSAGQLAALRDRIGHRYVLVGEEGDEPVTHVFFWDLFIVVPAPYVVVWFNIPIEASRENNVAHATRILRVVDLASATVLAESYELLPDAPHEGTFSDQEMGAGLAAMGLR